MDANTLVDSPVDFYGEKVKNQTPLILVLIKAMSLMKCFTAAEPEHTINSLSEKLDMPKSTTHRLLITLQHGGFITSGTSGSYRLGTAVLELSSVLLHNLDYRQAARPVLQRLSDDVGENICLGTLDKTDVIYMDEVSANRYLAMGSRLGTISPAYSSAIGKMLMSELTRAQFDQVIAHSRLVAWTPQTIVDPEELWADLRNIAIQGYAYECGEFEEGVSGLAAPVRGPFGNAIAAFGINGSSARLNSGRLRSILPKLLSAADAISGALGYHASPRRETGSAAL